MTFLYSVEREFPVDVNRLWQAWTNAEELQQWYCPTALSVVPDSVVSDPRVGGMWKVAVDVPENGFVAYFWGRYTVIEPGHRIEHTLYYSQSEAEFVFADESGPNHRIVLDFENRGDCAWVRFSQFGELPEGQAEAARDGMESYLDNLAGHLAH